MNSRIRFFMTKEDEEEAFNKFRDSDYAVLDGKDNPIHIFYSCGEESVQFYFSKRFDKILTIGSFGIKTRNESEDSKRCEKLYKKMRKWIKDNYTNNLVVFNTKMMKREDATPPSGGGIWVSPRVEKLLENNQIILKQSKNTFSEYYIKK